MVVIELHFLGSSLELVTIDLNIDTSTFDVSTDNGGKIIWGYTNKYRQWNGIFMSGSGEFLANGLMKSHKFGGQMFKLLDKLQFLWFYIGS